MTADLTLAEGSGTSIRERLSAAGRIPHLLISGDGCQGAMRGGVLLRKQLRVADLIRAINPALGTDSIRGPAHDRAPDVPPLAMAL